MKFRSKCLILLLLLLVPALLALGLWLMRGRIRMQQEASDLEQQAEGIVEALHRQEEDGTDGGLTAGTDPGDSQHGSDEALMTSAGSGRDDPAGDGESGHETGTSQRGGDGSGSRDSGESASEGISESAGDWAAGVVMYHPSEEMAESVSEAIESDRTCRVIFVGDSRTVAMGQAEARIGDACVYIGEPGEGRSWFLETGLEQLEEAIEAHPDLPVLFNLGVNDLEEIDGYLNTYRELMDEHADTTFLFMSVNPVTEESPHVSQEEIEDFNRRLEDAFPDQYINTCPVLLEQGFESPDGVHYSKETYLYIHDLAIAWLDAHA